MLCIKKLAWDPGISFLQLSLELVPILLAIFRDWPLERKMSMCSSFVKYLNSTKKKKNRYRKMLQFFNRQIITSRCIPNVSPFAIWPWKLNFSLPQFIHGNTQRAVTSICLLPAWYVINQDVGTLCNLKVYKSSTAKYRNHQYHHLRSKPRFKFQAPVMKGEWVEMLSGGPSLLSPWWTCSPSDPGVFPERQPRGAVALLS